MRTIEQWADEGDFIQFNGHRVFVKQAGSDDLPVLLLIHGFPTASWDWEGVWDEFTEHFRVITLDMIGFGLSDKPKDYEYLITQQADLFEFVLEYFGVSCFHLLAHDYGDTVAQELLARQLNNDLSTKIESVCFLNGGLFPETHRPVFIQKLLLSPIGGLIAKLTSKAKLSKNLHEIFGPSTPPSKQVIDSFWQLIIQNNGKAIMHKLIHYMVQRKQYRERWVGALINSDIPLKLIAGVKDPISGAHMIERYKELVPNPDVTELTEIGHFPQVENSKQVLDAFGEFMKSCSVKDTDKKAS